MRRPEFVAAQSSHPRGWLGRLIGSLMVRETAGTNDAVLTLLGVGERDRVLDVGCGPGRTLERAVRLASRGHVVGVDVSDDMLRMAGRRCRSGIDAGTIELRHADAEALPFPDVAFDKVLSVHALYFWEQAALAVREIRRVLAPGGRAAIAFRTRDDTTFVANFPASVYRFYSAKEVTRLFEDAGFVDVVPCVTGAAPRVTVVLGSA